MSYRNWIISNFKEYDHQDEIETTIPMGDSLIEISSKNGKTIVVGVVEGEMITSIAVKGICESSSEKVNFLVAKSKSIWEGSAIDYAHQSNMGWGGMGDITSAFHTDRYGEIQKKEYLFVESNLSKHSKVSRLERLYDRVFKVHRIGGLSSLTVTLINSYELSAEEVRHARDKYGKFDVILKTNPNGNPTGRAYLAAEEIDAEICKWGELLGRLNKK
jgi:hypothetical protein